MLVAHELDLDVAWPGEVSLDVHLVAAEEALCLALGARHRVVDLGFALDDLHPAAAAAERRFDAHRPTELVAECLDLLGTLGELGGTRDDRRAATDGGEAARHLVGHLVHRSRRRTDELDSHRCDCTGEVGILGEEPVTGMHRVGTAALDDIEHHIGVDVALRCRLSAEGVGLVGETHVERIPIQLGIHRHRGNTHLPGSTDDADGNFATVGDQDLLEHE